MADDEEGAMSVKDRMNWLQGAFKDDKKDNGEGKQSAASPKRSSGLISERAKWVESMGKKEEASLPSGEPVKRGQGSLISSRKAWLDETSKQEVAPKKEAEEPVKRSSDLVKDRMVWLQVCRRFHLSTYLVLKCFATAKLTLTSFASAFAARE
jgi:hypothetical protein